MSVLTHLLYCSMPLTGYERLKRFLAKRSLALEASYLSGSAMRNPPNARSSASRKGWWIYYSRRRAARESGIAIPLGIKDRKGKRTD